MGNGYFPSNTLGDELVKAGQARRMRREEEETAMDRRAVTEAYGAPDYMSARTMQVKDKLNADRMQQHALYTQELEGFRDMVGQFHDEYGDLEASQALWDTGADELIRHGNPYAKQLKGMQYLGRHKVKMALPTDMTINGVTYPRGTVGVMYDAPGPDGVRVPQRFVPETMGPEMIDMSIDGYDLKLSHGQAANVLMTKKANENRKTTLSQWGARYDRALRGRYGTQTKDGYVLNRERMDEYNAAMMMQEELEAEGHSPEKAASIAYDTITGQGDRAETVEARGPVQTTPSHGTPMKGLKQRTRRVKRTGTLNGRRVIQYEDGDIEYAD